MEILGLIQSLHSLLFWNWFLEIIQEKYDISSISGMFYQAENLKRSDALVQSCAEKGSVTVRRVNHLSNYLKWRLSQANAFQVAYSSTPVTESKEGIAKLTC